ncbi:hypothetical protein KJ835_00375 [Patescibacteria group bacterium]|nr:hypothetical protein [Patescibacteria group bacterium]MBU1953731.1 hypothetical protein [Patescibacteria group bacterium]
MSNLLKNCLNGGMWTWGHGGARRFVYFAGETPDYDAIAAAAKAEMQGQAEKVESEIKTSEISADDAMKNAYLKIEKSANDVKGKIALSADTEAAKRLVMEIESAKKDVTDKIEANKARYEAIAAFVKKRAGLELMLDQNAQALKDLSSAQDVATLVSVGMGAEGLKEQMDDVNKLNVPGMENEVKDLAGRIGELQKQFDARTVELRRAVALKTTPIYSTIDSVVKINEADNQIPSQAQLQALREHANYLSTAMLQLKGMAFAAGVYKFLEQTNQKITDALMAAEKKIEDAASKDNPGYAKLVQKIDKLSKNRDNAYANLQKVENTPNASAQEKKDAKGWVSGAEETLKAEIAQRDAMEKELDKKMNPPAQKRTAGPGA